MASEPRTAMEKVACDLCGSEESTQVLGGPDRIRWLPGYFTLVRCQDCGLLYQNPRPPAEAITQFYEGKYHPYVEAIQDDPSVLRRWRRRFGMHSRCKHVLDYKSPGRLLDVGCGTGIFLDAMRSRGWQVRGVEPNREAARYSRERLGLDVFAGALEATDYPERTFDAVTLWDVLEHLPSPSAALRLFRRILKADGLLVLRVPNPESSDARLFGPYWAGWDLPRHYFVFSRDSMHKLLRRNGFDILNVSYEGGHPAFVISCRWWMDEHWPRADRVRRLADWGLDNLVTRLLAAPFLFITGPVLKRGAVMTVVARQQGGA